MNDLIQKLSSEHVKRPAWKNKAVILFGWGAFNFLYFLSMSVFGKELSMNSSPLFLSMMIIVSILCWIFFGQFLNQESDKPISFYAFSIVLLIIGGFLYEFFSANTISHTRPISLTAGDLHCFSHSVLRSLLPSILFPIVMKQFYVVQKNAAIFIGAIHLTMMSLILTELRCEDREIWHLVFGHQMSLVGVFLFLFLIFALPKKKTF